MSGERRCERFILRPNVAEPPLGVPSGDASGHKGFGLRRAFRNHSGSGGLCYHRVILSSPAAAWGPGRNSHAMHLSDGSQAAAAARPCIAVLVRVRFCGRLYQATVEAFRAAWHAPKPWRCGVSLAPRQRRKSRRPGILLAPNLRGIWTRKLQERIGPPPDNYRTSGWGWHLGQRPDASKDM